MANSSYYHTLMLSYDAKIKKAKQDRNNYQILKIGIKKLGIEVPNVSENLKKALEDYNNGGFISNNETFDNGVLDECCIELSNVDTEINSLLAKIDKNIADLENAIEEYQKLYNVASKNYDDSRAKEQGDENV